MFSVGRYAVIFTELFGTSGTIVVGVKFLVLFVVEQKKTNKFVLLLYK